MAWLITAKYKGNEQDTIRTNCSSRSTSLLSNVQAYEILACVPSALENGLQQSTIWTGWQGGPVLEENTLEPNSNRFNPSNSHLLCCSGPGLRTLPLPAIVFVNKLGFVFFKFLIRWTQQITANRQTLKEEKDANLSITTWIALD